MKLLKTAGLVFVFSLLTFDAFGQLGETELKNLDEIYGLEKPQQQVNYWKSMMKPQAGDSAKIYENLPVSWKKRFVDSNDKVQLIQAQIKPALDLYGKKYEISVIKFDKPFLMVDSDCVLIISTELLDIISSEDELIGLVMHEIAHSIFAEKTAGLHQALKDDRTREQAKKYLALAEYSCDAIAVRSMLYLNRQPLKFLELVVRTERSYKTDDSETSYHPPATERLSVASRFVDSSLVAGK